MSAKSCGLSLTPVGHSRSGAQAYDAGAPLLFAFDRGTIWLHSVAIAALKYDGLLWISYPKRSSKVETDLTRDRGWEVMTEAGLRPVTQVSIDALWSALRFRPLERVGR